MAKRFIVPRLMVTGQLFMISFSVRSAHVLLNFAKPESIPKDYWKKVILAAFELKKRVQENDKKCLNLLNTKHVTLLFEKPHGRFQLAFSLACSILGARKTFYFESNFENQSNPADSAMVLSQLTDMFVVHGAHQDFLKKLAAGATVPLFPASSNIHCFQKVLSDVMTLQERFNKLKGLILTWYGSGKMSPVQHHEKSECELVVNSSKPFKTVIEGIKGAHVIATSMHPDKRQEITLEVLKNADPDWVFIHPLPRSQVEVSDDVFYHKNNLSWKTSENYLYVAMAVILTNLKNYEPKADIFDYDKKYEYFDSKRISG